MWFYFALLFATWTTSSVILVVSPVSQYAYAPFTVDKYDKEEYPPVTTDTFEENATATTDTFEENVTATTDTFENSPVVGGTIDTAVAKLILSKIKYESEKISDTIFGQVTNVGDETAKAVRVLLSYYDKESFLLSTGNVAPEQDILEPGQRSAFTIMVDEDTGDKMEAYKISIKWAHPDGSHGYTDNVQLEDESNYLENPNPKKLNDEAIGSNEYISSQWGIKLNYPIQLNLSPYSTNAGECKNKNQCLIVFNKEDNPKTSFTMMIQPRQQIEEKCQCNSLLGFSQYEYKTMFENLDGFSFLYDNQTTIKGNISAIQMEYDIVTNNDVSRNFVMWTKVNDIFYTINYHNSIEDYSNFSPSFNAFLQSIEFSAPTEGIQSIKSEQQEKQPSFMSTYTPPPESQQLDTTTPPPTNGTSISQNDVSNKTVDNEGIISGSSTTTSQTNVSISDSNFDIFFINPESHLFEKVSITGKIFNIIPPSVSTGGIQIYHLGNSDRGTIISYEINKINAMFNKEECVKVEGSAGPTQQYTNLFGGMVSSPLIYADSIQKIDCFEMVDPNSKVIPIEHSVNKGGIQVTLHKVVFDQKNTQTFLSVENTNGGEDDIVRFYDTTNSLAFQGKKQYEAQYSSSSYPEISSEIPPGIEESGVVFFEPLQYGEDTKFQFTMSIGIEDYKFVFNTNTIGGLNNQGDGQFNNQVDLYFGEDEESTNNSEQK